MLYTPNLPKAASEHNSKTQIAVGASRSCGAGMHRSAAEGRFGEMRRRSLLRREPARSAPEGAARRCAEPAGRASVCARARTLGVNMLSENAFKEMPTLADKSSDFGFSSGIQVYFWTQRVSATAESAVAAASAQAQNIVLHLFILSMSSVWSM